jgi:hypothetical protein
MAHAHVMDPHCRREAEGGSRGVSCIYPRWLRLLYSYTTVLPIYSSTVYVYESSDIPPRRPTQGPKATPPPSVPRYHATA